MVDRGDDSSWLSTICPTSVTVASFSSAAADAIVMLISALCLALPPPVGGWWAPPMFLTGERNSDCWFCTPLTPLVPPAIRTEVSSLTFLFPIVAFIWAFVYPTPLPVCSPSFRLSLTRRRLPGEAKKSSSVKAISCPPLPLRYSGCRRHLPQWQLRKWADGTRADDGFIDVRMRSTLRDTSDCQSSDGLATRTDDVYWYLLVG